MRTTTTQRRAQRLPFWRVIGMTGVVACTAMVFMVPARAEDGDIIVQREVTPRIAYRGVPTDALPVRTAVSPFPTRAFDQSIGSVMSVLSDTELNGLHASLNHPSLEGARAIPPEVGVVQPAGALLSTGVAVAGAAPGGAGGQVVQATAGIAGQISGAVKPLTRGGQP